MLVESNMLPLGTKAPGFNLYHPKENKYQSLDELTQGDYKAHVIMFICNHCPYVIHILEKLIEVTNKYSKLNINFIAISANNPETYPADSPEKMKDLAINNNFCFPYLFDETQQTAKDYMAACTPDFYIFDNHKSCVYRGRFDASTPGNGVDCTGEDLTNALDKIISNEPILSEQYPSMGCNIKWKC